MLSYYYHYEEKKKKKKKPLSPPILLASFATMDSNLNFILYLLGGQVVSSAENAKQNAIGTFFYMHLFPDCVYQQSFSWQQQVPFWFQHHLAPRLVPF